MLVRTGDRATATASGRGVPGVVGTGWVGGRAIPVYYPPMPQDPYLVIFSLKAAKGPTHGQMKLILCIL